MVKFPDNPVFYGGPYLLLLAPDSASRLETAQGEVEGRLDPEILFKLFG